MKDIPAVYSSGWYDPFAAGVSEQYAHMAAQNQTPQWLVLGPWNHGGMRGLKTTAVGEVDFGASAGWGNDVLNLERLRWFDHWLKDIDTSVEQDPEVRLFVMGSGDGRKNKAGKMNHGGRWRALRTPFYL